MKKTTKAQIPSVSKGGEDSSRTDEEDQDYVPSESAFGLDSAAETERSGDTDKMSDKHDAPDGDDITHAIPSWTLPVDVSGNWDDVSSFHSVM